MKKNAIITYLLAISLLLSACVYRIPENTENTPPSSDTSTSFDSNDDSCTSETSDNFEIGDNITVGPYIFQYVCCLMENGWVCGWALEYCEESVEDAIIPSEVAGIPVIGIGVGQDVGVYDVYPFGKNSALKSIELPDSLLYIGDKVFFYCTNLSYIKLPGSIANLGEDSPYSYSVYNKLLENTAVTILDVPEGVERLEAYIFSDSSLETVILPSTLLFVEYYAFGNTPLKEVFYRGTEDQCPQTLLDQVAETEATLYYLSEEEPTEEGDFWHYVDGKPVIW